MFVQRWAIFILVLIILVVSVMAGVLNTLLNNILAKRKEFAVLRTIGVRPMGILKIIVTQISFYLLIGLVFGAFCGLVFSLIVSLIDYGRVAIDFPLMWGVAASMWFISLFIFIPVGWVMENKKISMEILSDNK
ncbi:peptide ABC transporter permease [Planococcus liqunii]|uniref:FtsX-like permease family protein n=1 Tax=Planococcus liqunii TaxID=3058394 RepID=UPI00263544D6|nr:FtsX-like permease family protein [Planococcus sp. N056]WKA52260.1 peptide ABC transporter permease [Planococcus sp. N056]